MAGFLRRKPKENPNPIQVPEKPVALLTSDGPPTPVYAKFASALAQEAPTPPRRDSISNVEPIRRNDYASNRGPPARTSLKLDKPLPPPKLDSDPLTEPPPQSNLPPSRRFSSNGRPTVRSDDRRTSAASPSLPPNPGPSLPQKESFLSRITKSNVAPSSYNSATQVSEPKMSRSSSRSSLFRKSSAQDLQHRESSSNKLKSSSRYSLADRDTISQQTSGAGKPNLPTPHVRGHMKRTSRDFSPLHQERTQPSGYPSDPLASQNEKPYPLPPSTVSRSTDELKGPPNIVSSSPPPNNMEVLRPTPPPTDMYASHMQPRKVSPPSQADHRGNRQSVNGHPTPRKPLIFAATAMMGNDVQISNFSSPPQPPQPLPNSPPRHPQPIPSQNYPSPPDERLYRQPSANKVDPARRVSHTPSTFSKHPSSSTNQIPRPSTQPHVPPTPFMRQPYDIPPSPPNQGRPHTQPRVPSPPLMRQPSRNDLPPNQFPRPHTQPQIPSHSLMRQAPRNDTPPSQPLFTQPVIPQKQKKTTRSSSVSTPEPVLHKLTKSRPSTPVSPGTPAKKPNQPAEFAAPVGVPLDEDPFANSEGVRMISPSKEALASREDIPMRPRTREDSGASREGPAQPSADNGSPPRPAASTPITPPSPPVSPEEYRNARTKRRGEGLERVPPPSVAHIPLRLDRPAEPFPLDLFLSEGNLLSMLLGYLSFYEWCNLSSVSKKIRLMFVRNRPLTEVALERFLSTVGYGRWIWPEPEPLTLTLMDLHDYMRGVSVPSHEYARVAELYLPTLSLHPSQRDPVLLENVRHLTAATRAYTRVVLRLRTQAEKESSRPASSSASQRSVSVRPNVFTSPSRSGSRPPSPTASSSHSNGYSPAPRPPTPVSGFRSPLYRLRRAPLLRVFVPSPDGDWLSDASVLECEAELRRAGIQNLLRMGDVVWDMAVGDEGNAGRLVWDGSYLIDLDYSYSAVGDLPKYLPNLAFPPSYFHRVIRAGPAAGNPLIRIDISPWGPEIAANLQLLQDRIRTETPQGNVHNVVRWVHRSTFAIRPPRHQRQSTKGRPSSPRIPIPDSNLFIDCGWYGTVVVETEGTNECLADLQDRCGPGAFPPRALPVADMTKPRDKDSKMVFRILRERSRPGEIWIRAVGPKERII